MFGAGRSLRAKIILILAGVVLIYVALDGAVQRFIVYPSFERLEEQGAQRDLERVREAFASELSHLELRSWDWTRLPEVTRLLDGESRRVGVLDTSILARNRVNLLMLCAADGRVLWGGTTLDPQADVPVFNRFRDFPTERLASNHPLLAQLDPATGRELTSGLMRTEHGTLLVTARTLETPAGNAGRLLMGRLMTPSFAAGLSGQTGVNFGIRAIEDPPADPAAKLAFDEATATGNPVLRAVNDDGLEARLCLNDLQHAPILVIEARLERAITRRGERAIQYAISSTLAAGLLMMLVLLFLLQRAVLRPLDALTRHALEVGRTDALERRLGSTRSDEIGVLAREFDSMVEKLEHSRAELLRTARAAGMSEIANGVLHNVGNVLNSVNVSATLVSQQVARSGAADLQRVMETIRKSGVPLEEFVASDPRGKHLDPLLEQIADQLLREQESVRRELGSLNSGIEHIKQLISSQQSVAGHSGVLESVRLDAEVRRALELTGNASSGSEPRIHLDMPDLGAVRVDRHRLVQILVNIVQNARQSLVAAGGPEPTLRIRAELVEGQRIHLSVEDNGVGIPAENLARIFTHGFTTRRDGHGFGLHSCANAASEMGGKLSARSEGRGKGAIFTLDFPWRPVEAAVPERST